MKILVTGGAGYIGSHTCLELLRAGHDLIVVDNLSNSHAESLGRVRALSGRDFVFHQDDIRDPAARSRIFSAGGIDSVVHFAGLTTLGNAQVATLNWDNNVTGTLVLLAEMEKAGVRTLVFSSSCTVYGDPASVPIREDAPVSAVNPYGMTKLTIERILQDIHRADPSWNIAVLRYFNPVGADPSGTARDRRRGSDPDAS